MLNTALSKPFSAVLTFYIPCGGMRNGASDVLIWPVSASVYARFMVRYSAFQALIWGISRAERVHFARHKNPY